MLHRVALVTILATSLALLTACPPVEHVVAVAPGESALIITLERYLSEHAPRVFDAATRRS